MQEHCHNNPLLSPIEVCTLSAPQSHQNLPNQHSFTALLAHWRCKRVARGSLHKTFTGQPQSAAPERSTPPPRLQGKQSLWNLKPAEASGQAKILALFEAAAFALLAHRLPPRPLEAMVRPLVLLPVQGHLPAVRASRHRQLCEAAMAQQQRR